MSDVDLAALAREREARRGVPVAPRPTSGLGLPKGRTLWVLLGVVLLSWSIFARTQQANCGCGDPESFAKRFQATVEDAAKDPMSAFSAAFESFGKGLERASETCHSPVSSAVCHTACWMAGNQVQKKLWWACVKESVFQQSQETAAPPRGQPSGPLPEYEDL